jgi:excisionase family DNA binding protein
MDQEAENRVGRTATATSAEGDRPLTKDELANYYGVERRTIEHWMAKRYIPFVKIGKTVRFYRADVDEAVKKGFGIGYRPRAGV